MSASIFKRANDSDDDNCLHFDATLSQDASSEDDGASPSQFVLLSGVVLDNSRLLTLSTVTKGDNAEVPMANDDDDNDDDNDNNDDDDADDDLNTFSAKDCVFDAERELELELELVKFVTTSDE